MMINVDKRRLSQELLQSLGIHHREKYIEYVNERRNIYFTGFGIGLFLTGLVLLGGSKLYGGNVLGRIGRRIRSMPSWHKACVAGSITFVTTYYYYILSKKSGYMISELETKEERRAWLKMYKTMQWNYHMGFLLGILGVISFYVTQ